MIKDNTVLAVIPARGGSKRCPRKNIKDFRGKPLILWTIEAAQQSKYIDTLVVSTEDAEIKSVADPYCYVIDRPQELATDTATNEDVMRHALAQYHHADIVVLLQPTSPLRLAADIDDCIKNCAVYVPSITFNGQLKKNGAVYVCYAVWLAKGGNFNMYYCYPHIMPDERSLDIDYLEQFNG